MRSEWQDAGAFYMQRYEQAAADLQAMKLAYELLEARFKELQLELERMKVRLARAKEQA
jgi:hypothetical protein